MQKIVCLLNETLIYENAANLQSLKKKIKNLIYDFEEIEVESENFEVVYDLTSFFENHSYLNITEIAKRADINPGLMRQYTSGIKFPSEDRVKIIEKAIKEIGKELIRVKLHKPQRELA